MALKIFWTHKARLSFLAVLEYLCTEWSYDVALEFRNRVDVVLRYLSTNPNMGRKEEMLPHNIRSYLISKNTKLFYRIVGNEMHLIKFFDTRQHPDRALE